MATLEDLEARVAALGANQREMAATLREHGDRLGRVEHAVGGLHQEMRAGFRTADEHFAELRDLIVERRNGT